MCENDAAVDAWFLSVNAQHNIARALDDIEARVEFLAKKSGCYAGVIRELAATVPGVREWLVGNMPKGDG